MLSLLTEESSHVSDIVKMSKLFETTESFSRVKCSLDFKERIFK